MIEKEKGIVKEFIEDLKVSEATMDEFLNNAPKKLKEVFETATQTELETISNIFLANDEKKKSGINSSSEGMPNKANHVPSAIYSLYTKMQENGGKLQDALSQTYAPEEVDRIMGSINSKRR